MMRWIVICLLVAGGLLFLLSFGLGAGYGLSGGEVQLFPRWAESHSESGVAIAVYENQGEISTENTPAPRQPRSSVADGIVPLAFVVAAAVGGWLLWNGFKEAA